MTKSSQELGENFVSSFQVRSFLDLFPGLGGGSVNPWSFESWHKKKANPAEGRAKKQKGRKWLPNVIIEQLNQTEPEASLGPGFPKLQAPLLFQPI